MQDLASPPGIVALAAAVVALAALAGCLVLSLRVRRLRASQRLVLGEHSQDLVAHAAALQEGFERLTAEVDRRSASVHDRVEEVERRLEGAIAYRALVRYDAYNEMSGRQSTSVALLDASRSGVVLSSIHHREQVRLYAKQVRAGQSELELSPEEAEAVRLALDDHGPGVPADRPAP